MKKILKIAICLLLAGALAFGALCVYAEQTYSSKDDPLISLSYINEVLLPQIKTMIEQTLAGVEIGDVIVTVPPETTEAPVTTEPEPPVTTEPVPEIIYPAGTVHTGSQFAIVNLQAGETVFASLNACEVIVRSGQTKVVSPFTVKWEEQGVSDTTDGKELYNEATVPNNHTILIPRDDGRGIVAGEGGAWLMVRGDYRIVSDEPAETTADPAETMYAPIETDAEPVETTGAAE